MERAIISIIDKRVMENSSLQSQSLGKVSQFHKAIDKVQKELFINEGVKKRFVVQFNPNNLTLSTKENNKKFKMSNVKNTQTTAGVYTCRPKPSMIHMDVELIMDKVNPGDSFMNEKSIQIMNKLRKKEFTIQPYVEGFIETIRNPNTRTICFNWGNFEFMGKLKKVESTYTMFNQLGYPVRAKIKLTIVANYNSSNGKAKASDMFQFQQLFGNSENFSDTPTPNISKGVSKVGNLLKLPF